MLDILLWMAAIYFGLLILGFGAATGTSLANRGKPKTLSPAEIRQRHESRTKKIRKLTLANLSESEGFEYTRLLAQENQRIPGTTERLDQLETAAQFRLFMKELEA